MESSAPGLAVEAQLEKNGGFDQNSDDFQNSASQSSAEVSNSQTTSRQIRGIKVSQRSPTPEIQFMKLKALLVGRCLYIYLVFDLPFCLGQHYRVFPPHSPYDAILTQVDSGGRRATGNHQPIRTSRGPSMDWSRLRPWQHRHTSMVSLHVWYTCADHA